MSRDPNAFIRDLIPHNLPLAARCAAAGETAIDPVLVRDLQSRLIARTQDMSADLRARIAAGEALGMLGDPRFERKTGAYGDFLLPPLVSIEGGTYPIGDDASGFDDEKPAHTVELAPFQIGMFPVTNAEYALFIAAGGYEDERWWDTDEAKAWLRGEGSNEGGKRQWRENRRTLQGWSEEDIRGLVRQNRITSQQADDWITVRNWSDERFEQQLDEWYPSGRTYRQPEFWNDARFNNPAQPVVGVTWFEARAYCAWLTANAFPSPPAPLPQGERGVEHVERWAITPELATTMTEIARRLRRDATSSEDMLWQALRNRQLDGRKFRRQEAVGAFVLDLYCPQERLAVEIDGGIHDLPEQQRADAARQALLESLGIRFVRLPAALVEQNLAAALARIRAAFLPTPQTGSARVLPSPLCGRGSGVRGFRLPTEVEFEAAARGKGGRKFAYGAAFDSARCNTFESHLRRSTPVGIFDNATPEGVFDLSGNVYTWTTTIYDQEAYPYPYNQDDGREDVSRTDVLRVLRGGSWRYNQNNARAAFRNWDLPNVRGSDVGFRVVVGFVPI